MALNGEGEGNKGNGNVVKITADAIEKAKAGSAKKPRKERTGRIDGRQESVIKLMPLRERMEALVMLYNAATDASTDLSEAIKETAELTGLYSKTVRAKVAAVARDKVEERLREINQLSLVFEDKG